MMLRTQSSEATIVTVPTGGPQLAGDLTIPPNASGIVLFAHGSGSSRFSSRNRFVGQQLNDAGLATLLIDLLSSEEERIDAYTAELRFDIPMLAERLVNAIDWLLSNESTRNLPIGIFGASTGGGAALVAAARRPQPVGAVVSRGGRPDLAGDALPDVRCPTLLIVGGADDVVIQLNQQAQAQMQCETHLAIVPGAGHLFEESGALEQVAHLSRDWFNGHLPAAAPRTRQA